MHRFYTLRNRFYIFIYLYIYLFIYIFFLLLFTLFYSSFYLLMHLFIIIILVITLTCLLYTVVYLLFKLFIYLLLFWDAINVKSLIITSKCKFGTFSFSSRMLKVKWWRKEGMCLSRSHLLLKSSSHRLSVANNDYVAVYTSSLLSARKLFFHWFKLPSVSDREKSESLLVDVSTHVSYACLQLCLSMYLFLSSEHV